MVVSKTSPEFIWGDLVPSKVLPYSNLFVWLSVVENAAGIAFAYPTNRKWVFRSNNPNILAEAGSFVGSRLITMLLGWLTNLLLVNVLGVSLYLSTVISSGTMP